MATYQFFNPSCVAALAKYLTWSEHETPLSASYFYVPQLLYSIFDPLGRVPYNDWVIFETSNLKLIPDVSQ